MGRRAGMAFRFGPLFFSDGTVLAEIKRAEGFGHSGCDDGGRWEGRRWRWRRQGRVVRMSAVVIVHTTSHSKTPLASTLLRMEGRRGFQPGGGGCVVGGQVFRRRVSSIRGSTRGRGKAVG